MFSQADCCRLWRECDLHVSQCICPVSLEIGLENIFLENIAKMTILNWFEHQGIILPKICLVKTHHIQNLMNIDKYFDEKLHWWIEVKRVKYLRTSR